MADYRLEWARFADWCAATDQTALPASPQTVAAYLTEEQPARGTAARWIAAIRHQHHRARLPDPCHGPVTRWARRARNGQPTNPEAIYHELAEPVQMVQITGWPAGLFGRRDRLAYLLHHLGPVPANTLTNLQAGQVQVTAPGTVTVTGANPTDLAIESPPGPQGPDLCVACAVARWTWALHQAAVFADRTMAETIAAQPPEPEHICHRISARQPAGPPDWPLFPAIDLWGNLPTPPVPAISVTGMESLLRAVARGQTNRQTIPIRPPAPQAQPPEPAPIPAPPQLHIGDWRDGVAARARAREALADIDDELDAVSTTADEVTTRIQQLLDSTDSD